MRSSTSLLASRRVLLGWLAWAAYAANELAGGPDLATVALLTAMSATACWIVLARFGRDGLGVLLALAIVAAAVATGWSAVAPPASLRGWSWSELGYLAFYPLLAVAVGRLVRRQDAATDAAGTLDTVIGALVVAALGDAVLAGEVYGHGELRVVGHLGYLLADLGILGFLAVSLAVGGRRALAVLAAPAAGLAMLAAADAVDLIELAEHPGATPAAVTVAWPAGLLLLAMAGPGRHTWSARPRRRIALLLASAVASLAVTVLGRDGSLGPVLAAIALGLIVVRLGLSLVRNLALVEELEAAAITDPLTGLANRTLLVDRIAWALARRRRHGGHVAVLFLDLDDFKTLNDQHGHAFGDQVLRAVGDRLRRALRLEDTVARAHGPAEAARDRVGTVGRLGGDEFVLVVEDLHGAPDAASVAHRVLAEVRAPLVVEGVELLLETSMGVALSDGSGDARAEDLLRDADTAMYVAKRSSQRDVEVFEPAMHEEVVARADLVSELRRAVPDGQLCLLYQPQVDLASGEMTGVEALVRWDHPRQGRLTPDRFIPAAESSGSVVAIDDWVLGEACAQLARWDAEGLPELTMAVNMSARGLTRGSLQDDVSRALRDAGLAPGRLELEITETVAVEHHDEAVRALAGLRAAGVKAAIDDFGMGHSALSRLQTFPVDRLKIDRSFVAALSIGTEHESIAAAMIAMADSLGLDIIAEGVETEEHRQALLNLGCPLGQGYLFSRPVEADDVPPLAAAPLAPPAPAADRSAPRRPVDADGLTRTLLAELQRLTDLESTYLTRVDAERTRQRVTHALNAGNLHIPERLEVDWADTICRRALESGVRYTDDVPTVFADSRAAAELGLQTYVSVPVVGPDGSLRGTLCGASTRRVGLNEQAQKVMEGFARLIGGMG